MSNNQHKNSDYRLLMRVLRVASPFKNLFWWSVILSVIITPFSIAQPFIVQLIVDKHIVTGIYEGILFWSMIYIIVLVVNVVMKYYFIFITAKLGQNVIMELRNRVFKHVVNLRSRYFDTTPIGTSTTRTINDIEAINNVFAQGVITILADIITIIAVTGLMLYTSWRLTLIVFITMPFMVLATYIFKEKVKVSYQKVRNQISNMNAFLQERISGMKTVQIFHAEQKEMGVFREINRKYTSANLDSVFYYAIFFPFVELVSSVALALMIWLGAKGYLDDKVSFGALVAFPLYLNLLFRPIRFLADKFNTMQMGLVAAERVFKLLDTHEHIPDTGDHPTEKLTGKVEFKDVSFAYDNENFVLNDVNLQIEGGHKMAIVGSTGSGKSTIINILNRFYDIQKGNIFIDDVDIREFPLKSLRERIAIVLQDVFLFHGTVYENITLMDKTISLEKVRQAAVTIGAEAYIENLPKGYDFVVTERGGNLSVGQRQLISFVRALVFDPDILILDEATSSIDTETEMVIQHAIEKLIEKRTSIIIAHRLSTIRNVDKIVVLEQGSIIESGSHEELMARENGHYKELFEKQFSDSILLAQE